MFSNLLSFLSFWKFMSCMSLYCKIWCSQTGNRWTYNRAHALCVRDK